MIIKQFLNLLPAALRTRVFYRFLNMRQHLFAKAFKRAPLFFNKHLHMHDLVVGDVISGQIALTGFYEYGLSREILQKAQSVCGEGLFVDVGANLGYFSLLWLGANAGNRAVAIEASERNQRLLKRNIEANRMQDRAKLLNVAAGDHNGTVRFDSGPAEQTGWGGIVEGSNATRGVEVEMVRLDAVIDDPIAVLKIDVEGADSLVLRGCEKLLQQKMIQTIYFEQNPVRMERLGIQAGEAQALLEQAGYHCTTLGDSTDEWVAYPV